MCFKNPSVDGVHMNGFYRTFTHQYVRVQSASTEQMNMEIDKIQCSFNKRFQKNLQIINVP